MRNKYILQVSAILAVLALCALLYTPVLAAQGPQHANARSNTTPLNAHVYLTAQTLQPLFQANISQQIPQIVGNALNSTIDQLPKQDQGWASQMANALLQPSATLLSLTPESTGLLTSIQVSLYPGDPKPTTLSLLIGFSVANASTIQISALPPANGGQSILSGPLTTMQIPLGTLNSIATTPNCGDSDLAINLQFPVALGSTSSTSSQSSMLGQASSVPMSQIIAQTGTASASEQTSTPTSYIEIPEASLAKLGSSLGDMPISSSLTAENIHVSTSGHNLSVTSDIHWHGLLIGTATSTMNPGAQKGNLVVTVQNTVMQILDGLISFPVNSYNQQIEQMLNTKLNGALDGQFTVAQASIGANPHVSCAAASSLILSGTLNLG